MRAGPKAVASRGICMVITVEFQNSPSLMKETAMAKVNSRENAELRCPRIH